MNRTITQVIDYALDSPLEVSTILNQPEVDIFKLRYRLKSIGISYYKSEEVTPHLVCPECYQPLWLSGSKFGELYFKHFSQSMECALKVVGNLNQEQIRAIQFNGQKEGHRHRQMKHAIADALRGDSRCMDVSVEQRRYDDSLINWRVPDVACRFSNHHLVFEIQLSRGSAVNSTIWAKTDVVNCFC